MLKVDFDFDVVRHDKDRSYFFLKSRGGIYAMNDIEGKHLYIGQTCDLYNRINSHLNGNTHTRRLYKNFYNFSVVYEEDEELRIVGELLLISKLKPVINASVRGRINHKLPTTKIIHKDKAKCNGITLEGNKCHSIAHLNGYCRFHGGDGMTLTKYVEMASKSAAKEYSEKKTDRYLD